MRLAYLLSVIQVVKATINVNISSQYDFTRAECEDGVVADVGDGMYGDLILDETVSCLDRVGIQSSDLIGGRPAAYSLGNSSGFLKTLQEPDEFPGFAVEVWITLGKDLKPWDPCEHIGSCEYVIISIHNNILGPIMDYCQETTDFQLSYNAFYRSFKVLMRYDSDSCNSFNTYEANLSKGDLQYPFQLVFTTAGTIRTNSGRDLGLFLWFINGTYIEWDVSYIQADFKLKRLITPWHEGYNVQFLDKVRHNTSTWFEERSTKLHRARIFSEQVALVGEYEAVAALFAEGVANSAPVSYNVTVEINEDGEAGDHYYDPGLYLQAFAVTELQNIYLDIYDSDNDPTTLNYNNDTFPRAFISVLPHIGHIFDPRSGGVVASTPYEVLGEGGVFPIKYRPLLNEYSSSSKTSDPYTTFSYYAEDGATTGHRSIEDGTVHVYVVSKNDPPRAFDLTINMLAATREIILNLLQGASDDVDDSNEVQGAEIYKLPKKGTIRQVKANGRLSTNLLSAGERVWTGGNVSYRCTGVGTDSFTYRVYDLYQTYSLPATVNIVVYTEVSGNGWWQRLRTMTYFFLAALSMFTIMILSYKLFVVFFESRSCSFNFGQKETEKGDAGKSEDNKGKYDKDKCTIGPSRGHGMSASRKDGHHEKRASAGKKSTSKKSTSKKSTGKKSTNIKSTSEKSTSRTTKKGVSSRKSQDKPVKAVKTVVPTITSA